MRSIHHIHSSPSHHPTTHPVSDHPTLCPFVCALRPWLRPSRRPTTSPRRRVGASFAGSGLTSRRCEPTGPPQRRPWHRLSPPTPAASPSSRHGCGGTTATSRHCPAATSPPSAAACTWTRTPWRQRPARRPPALPKLARPRRCFPRSTWEALGPLLAQHAPRTTRCVLCGTRLGGRCLRCTSLRPPHRGRRPPLATLSSSTSIRCCRHMREPAAHKPRPRAFTCVLSLHACAQMKHAELLAIIGALGDQQETVLKRARTLKQGGPFAAMLTTQHVIVVVSRPSCRTCKVAMAHLAVRARAVCIRVTTRAPARAAPSHTQASTASRRADHATRPRRAPTRARGAEPGAHRSRPTRSVARPSRPGPADAAPGLAAAVGHGRAAPTHAPTKKSSKMVGSLRSAICLLAADVLTMGGQGGGPRRAVRRLIDT